MPTIQGAQGGWDEDDWKHWRGGDFFEGSMGQVKTHSYKVNISKQTLQTTGT